MLYHLLYPLRVKFGALNVFQYLTFRSILAFFIAIVLVLIFQPKFIRWFRSREVGQPIRSDGPESHLSKKGTPTMGGIVVVGSVLTATLLLADLTNTYVWAVVGVTAFYALLGFIDDYKKVRVQNSKGVRAKTKLVWQIVAAALAVTAVVLLEPEYSTAVTMPFFKNVSFDLGW
ncbi:MAG: phospho-N-acetylmuramoyl-pentapeptide-transferase, partial [Bdellovibrionales bacterium]|nr:phospho-N-acetylmuramoyl-pentapeptide-transferase [Bdellovibrionales bacterium]